MKIGICTIQRNRGYWLHEWVSFHYLMGVRKFYIYLHKCTDNSVEVVSNLMRFYDIKCFTMPDDVFRPQLVAYQNAYANFGDEVDWMAFIDGDEFLFPTSAASLPDAMQRFEYEKVSAVGAWWVCFGSNNHQQEPEGLIIENYTRRPDLVSHENNHTFKSIVRGRQGDHFSVLANAHHFKTLHGTVDEKFVSLHHGRMPEVEPTYAHFRLNHYILQSYEYFKKYKQFSGAADAGSAAVRPEEAWRADDINDIYDDAILAHLEPLKRELARTNFTQKEMQILA